MTKAQLKDEKTKDRMIYLPSQSSERRSFRCECGCNVFRTPLPKTDPLYYVCNACGAGWRGA